MPFLMGMYVPYIMTVLLFVPFFKGYIRALYSDRTSICVFLKGIYVYLCFFLRVYAYIDRVCKYAFFKGYMYMGYSDRACVYLWYIFSHQSILI